MGFSVWASRKKKKKAGFKKKKKTFLISHFLPLVLCLGPKQKEGKTDFNRSLLNLFGSKPLLHRENVS